MRETQFIGLNRKGENYIKKHAVHKGGKFVCEEIGEVEGMFGEVVHKLRRFVDRKTGAQFQEFIQLEPWSSGPMIFLALEKVESDGSTAPIEESLWVNDSNLTYEFDAVSGTYNV